MKKLPLTFVIPIKIDTDDRQRNFDIVVGYLLKNYDCPIIIKEADWEKRLKSQHLDDPRVKYMFEHLEFGDPFHRTKYINEMVNECETECFANYDVDVIFNPSTIEESVKLIMDGKADVVYPFGDGEMDQCRLWISSKESIISLIDTFDGENLLRDIAQKTVDDGGKMEAWTTLAGHCQIFRKKSFLEGYMENENFVSWGPEDAERLSRFRKLGFRVQHLSGEKLIHLEHESSVDSGKENPYFTLNETLLKHLTSLSDDEFKKYYEEVSYTEKYTSRNGDK